MGRRHAGRIRTGWSFWVKLRRSLVQIVPGEKAKREKSAVLVSKHRRIGGLRT
jgi:hypothetical protein